MRASMERAHIRPSMDWIKAHYGYDRENDKNSLLNEEQIVIIEKVRRFGL